MPNITNENITQQKQLLRDRGICVIVPTYNNEKTIVDVVTRTMEQCSDVIVVCDGCTDNTVSLLKSLEISPIIIELKDNKGKGFAIKTGFKYALSHGFAYAITLDGDGQHYPEDIALLLTANQRNPGAIIVGSRKSLNTVERRKGSKFANNFSNFWFFIQTGRFLEDTQTGYRLYPLKKLHGLSFLTSRYEAELELLVFSSWHGIKLVSEPINVFYPSKEERVSHFRPIQDFLRITILNIVLLILTVIYGLPLRIFNALRTPVRTIYCLLFFLFNMFLLILPITFIYLHIGKITAKKKENLHKLIKVATKYVLVKHGIPGVKYSQTNIDNENFTKPSLIICNHQSHLDLLPILMQSHKIVALTNNEVWNNPFYGYIIRNADYFSLSMGYEQIESKLMELVENGYSLVIFPEGTRSQNCEISRFHQGAVHIAQKLNLDILPLIVYGTGKVLPKHGRAIHKWRIHCDIGSRVSTSDLALMGNSTKEISSEFRKYYVDRYSKITNYIEQYV